MTRLMCSKDRKEVESVKSELFRNGIRSEIRTNPVAEALRVSRLELWVQDECDYFKASRLYASFQERDRNDTPRAATRESKPAGGPEPEPEVFIDAEELSPRNASPSRAKEGKHTPEPVVSVTAPGSGPIEADLAEVSGLLEKDIENLLAHDSDLNVRCDSLEKTIEALKVSLSEAEARVAAETSARAAAENKAADMANVQVSLKRELAGHAAAEEKLQRTVTGLRADLETRTQAAAAATAKLESQAHQLKEQQTLVIALRNELGAREQNLQDLGEALTKAGVELGTEKQARSAAESRLSECAVARAELEQQVAEQVRELQKVHAELQARDAQVQAYVARLNAIRGKLQGRG